MRFKSRRSKELSGCNGVAQIMLMMIGIAGMLYFFSLAEPEHYKDYFFELLIIALMFGSYLYGFFYKSNNTPPEVEVLNDTLIIDQIKKIPLSKLRIDIYRLKGAFNRCHIWDTDYKFVLYSMQKDALFRKLLNDGLPYEAHDISTIEGRKIIKLKLLDGSKLTYSLEDGSFSKVDTSGNKGERYFPKYILIDPDFKRVRV